MKRSANLQRVPSVMLSAVPCSSLQPIWLKDLQNIKPSSKQSSSLCARARTAKEHSSTEKRKARNTLNTLKNGINCKSISELSLNALVAVFHHLTHDLMVEPKEPFTQFQSLFPDVPQNKHFEWWKGTFPFLTSRQSDYWYIQTYILILQLAFTSGKRSFIWLETKKNRL